MTYLQALGCILRANHVAWRMKRSRGLAYEAIMWLGFKVLANYDGWIALRDTKSYGLIVYYQPITWLGCILPANHMPLLYSASQSPGLAVYCQPITRLCCIVSANYVAWLLGLVSQSRGLACATCPEVALHFRRQNWLKSHKLKFLAFNFSFNRVNEFHANI